MRYNVKEYKRTCNGVGLIIIMTNFMLILVGTVLVLLSYNVFGINPLDSVLEPLINAITSILSIFTCALFYSAFSPSKLRDLVPVNGVRANILLPLTIASTAVAFVANFMTDILLSNFSIFKVSNGVSFENDIPDTGVFLLQLISVAVIPALVEEFLFRGVILHALLPYGATPAIFISSVFFALLHGNIVQIPFTFVVGITLGFATVKTGSLLPAMLIHFINNMLSVVTERLLQSGIDETAVNLIYFSAVLLIAVGGLISASKLSKNRGFFSLESLPRGEYRSKIKNCFSSAGIIVAVVILALRTIETIKIG